MEGWAQSDPRGGYGTGAPLQAGREGGKSSRRQQRSSGPRFPGGAQESSDARDPSTEQGSGLGMPGAPGAEPEAACGSR